MDVKFNFHDALLGITTIVAWADGENQKSELDARVQMILHEEMDSRTIDSFKAKYNQIDDKEKVFEASVEALKELNHEDRIKACAWAYQIAVIAKVGADGELDYDMDTWRINEVNVDPEEKYWIDKTLNALGVSPEEVLVALGALPDVKRI